jgi:type IV secretory pathway VirB10-like protein
MKFGLMLGVMVLAANVAFAQVAMDMTTLERRVEDAQAAFERNSASISDQQEMNEIRDELGYLRVKTRRGETVTRTDRQRLSDRIDRFMTRVGNGRTSSNNGTYDRRDRAGDRTNDRVGDRSNDRIGDRNDRIGSVQGRLEIPAGTEVDVRLLTPLSSDTAQVEDRVEATTLIDLYKGNDLLVPAGSTLTGWVTSVDRATRTDRQGKLTIEFNRINVNGRTRDTRAYVTQAIESEGIKGEAGRIGAGSAVGAIIGGILGGVKGAVAGILIGGGGVIAATEGKDVHLPEGTVLRVRFDTAVPLGY